MIRKTAIKRAIFFLFIDTILFFFTFFLAYILRFNFEIETEFLENFFHVFVVLALLKIAAMTYFNIYRVAWRFFSLREAKSLFYAHISAYSVFFIIFYLEIDFFTPFPRSVIVIDLFLSIFFVGTFRVLKRVVLENGRDKKQKKTMLIGATGFAQSIMKEQNDFYVDAVVDDDTTVIGTYFSDKIVRPFEDIEKIVKERRIESIIITKDIPQNSLQNIFKRLNALGMRNIMIATLYHDKRKIKNLEVEDLLARNPKDLDKERIRDFISGKKIFITGAGGSIGSEIARQCARYGAGKLVLLDHGEFNLYTIAEELDSFKPVVLLQSVVQKELLAKSLKEHKPHIVIHAAAYKHVPLLEDNVTQAILNNIVGTKNVIDCSLELSIEKVLLISTDKAVKPTNVMGATKRICELYAQNAVSLQNARSLESKKRTKIVTVRFGNVLGSSGSVVPKFKSQIEKGGPVTVTDPQVRRYFMLISEACALVLQAASIGKKEEIFILDMGEPVKIVDLAKKMIELSGRDDIDIEFTGLRPGEKLCEDLFFNEDKSTTKYESIMIAGKTNYDIEKLNQDIAKLLVADDKIARLKKIIPEFEYRS